MEKKNSLNRANSDDVFYEVVTWIKTTSITINRFFKKSHTEQTLASQK